MAVLDDSPCHRYVCRVWYATFAILRNNSPPHRDHGYGLNRRKTLYGHWKTGTTRPRVFSFSVRSASAQKIKIILRQHLLRVRLSNTTVFNPFRPFAQRRRLGRHWPRGKRTKTLHEACLIIAYTIHTHILIYIYICVLKIHGRQIRFCCPPYRKVASLLFSCRAINRARRTHVVPMGVRASERGRKRQ